MPIRCIALAGAGGAGTELVVFDGAQPGLGSFDGWERLFDDGDYEIEQLKRLGY